MLMQCLGAAGFTDTQGTVIDAPRHCPVPGLGYCAALTDGQLEAEPMTAENVMLPAEFCSRDALVRLL